MDPERKAFGSGHELVQQLTMDVGESEVSALETEGQSFVVQSEQMEQGGPG